MDLVTGGHGFIGQYLCKILDKHIAPPHHDFTTRSDKIFCRHGQFENVYHLGAWVGGIGFLIDKPYSIYDRNVKFALSLFGDFRPRYRGVGDDIEEYLPVKNVIVAGSVCEYPKGIHYPLKEHMLNDGEPVYETMGYGYAKRSIYNLGRMFEDEYGVRVLHCVLTNVYGPGDNSTHVVAELVRKFCDAKRKGNDVVDVWGNGEATRDLLYVSDAARLLKEAGERYYGPAINIATGVETTIRELAETIAWACDFTGKIRFDDSKPVGEPRRRIDISKMVSCAMLPHIEVKEGIKNTVEWYMNK